MTCVSSQLDMLLFKPTDSLCLLSFISNCTANYNKFVRENTSRFVNYNLRFRIILTYKEPHHELTKPLRLIVESQKAP